MGGVHEGRRSRSKRIGVSERLRRDRLNTKDKNAEQDSGTPIKPPQRPSTATVVLSKTEYAKHKRARDNMLSNLGMLSQRFHKKMITEEEMEELAVAVVKWCVRNVGLKRALRAWQDVFERMDRPDKRMVDDIPIKLYILELAWTQIFGWRNIRSEALLEPMPELKEKENAEKETDKVETGVEASAGDGGSTQVESGDDRQRSDKSGSGREEGCSGDGTEH